MSLQCCWATVQMCSITSRSPCARTQQHESALMLMNASAVAAADEKGNSVLIDLVEYCHVWWIPSFKGVQKVGL